MASQTFLIYHLIFTPKYRRPWLEGWTCALVAYAVSTICRYYGAHYLALNPGPARDHIHLLVCLPPDTALAWFVRDVKSMSGRLINAQRGTTGSPFWGAGYFAKTVGSGSLESAHRYVAKQWNEDAARTTPPDPEATVLKD